MFDTEKFICEIEARPAIYNVKCKDYANREKKAKSWNEIGMAMYEDWDSPELSSKEKDERVKELMKKWKTLRDCFVKDHRTVTVQGTGKAASSKKRYVYYDQLLFVLPYLKGNTSTASNIPPSAPANSDALNIEAAEEQADLTMDQNNGSFKDTNKTTVIGKPSNKRKLENQNVAAGKRAAFERSVASSANQLTNILAESVQMQREEKQSDRYGHRGFLLSYLPVLESMPFQQSMLLRGQISQLFTDYFLNLEVPSRSNSSMYSAPQTPASTIVTETSEVSDEFDISNYIRL